MDNPNTPDGLVAALKPFIDQKQPRLVLMPHTDREMGQLLP